MKWALLFPGQGAQHLGMGLDLAREYPSARRVFEEADRALGFSLSRLCSEGPAERLNLTEYTQPALVTASVAAWRVLESEGVEPSVTAGLSLGEYAALVAVGSLDFPDAVRLVRNRGRYMQECVPEGQGGMAAVIGLESAQVEDLCRQVSTDDRWVQPANYNGPGQIVISGHTVTVEAACQAALKEGAKKAVPLPVSAPFHCRLMDRAAERLRADLETVPLRAARAPLVTNYTGQALTDPGDLTEALLEGIRNPVRWDECVRAIGHMEPDVWAEIGPGKALASMVKRILSGTRVKPGGSVPDVRNLVEIHRGACYNAS